MTNKKFASLIKEEKETSKYYNELAKRIKKLYPNKDYNEMFEQMAKDEASHARNFEQLQKIIMRK